MKPNDLDVAAVPREDLPALLGGLVEAEARVRLRLAEAPTVPATNTSSRTTEEAAAIANTTKRWLLSKTRGLTFRCDLSRKQARFDEGGLRGWLARRRRVSHPAPVVRPADEYRCCVLAAEQGPQFVAATDLAREPAPPHVVEGLVYSRRADAARRRGDGGRGDAARPGR